MITLSLTILFATTLVSAAGVWVILLLWWFMLCFTHNITPSSTNALLLIWFSKQVTTSGINVIPIPILLHEYVFRLFLFNVFDQSIDISRGSVLASSESPPPINPAYCLFLFAPPGISYSSLLREFHDNIWVSAARIYLSRLTLCNHPFEFPILSNCHLSHQSLLALSANLQ